MTALSTHCQSDGEHSSPTDGGAVNTRRRAEVEAGSQLPEGPGGEEGERGAGYRRIALALPLTLGIRARRCFVASFDT